MQLFTNDYWLHKQDDSRECTKNVLSHSSIFFINLIIRPVKSKTS